MKMQSSSILVGKVLFLLLSFLGNIVTKSKTVLKGYSVNLNCKQSTVEKWLGELLTFNLRIS
jgi:hypothetical protein